jgi:hypothetical protein
VRLRAGCELAASLLPVLRAGDMSCDVREG